MSSLVKLWVNQENGNNANIIKNDRKNERLLAV